MAFYLLELKGPARFEQLVPLCGPHTVLSALLYPLRLVWPQVLNGLRLAGTHASSPRPTYSVSLEPISTTEAVPMCKHLPCAVLVQDYKRPPSQGELKCVTRVLFQTRSNRLCLGKWFKIATHTNARRPPDTSVQILARGLKFRHSKVILLFPFPLLMLLRAQSCELKNPHRGGRSANKDTCRTNLSLTPGTHMLEGQNPQIGL